MSYTPYYQSWKDYPNITTPATAAFFQHLEDGMVSLSGTSSLLPFTYTLTTDGTTISVKDKTQTLISTGPDLGVLLTALDAANTVFLLGPGVFPSSTRAGFSHTAIGVIGTVATSIASTSDGSGSNDSVIKWRSGATFGYCSNLTVSTSLTQSGVLFSDTDGYCEGVSVNCSSSTTRGIYVSAASSRTVVQRCSVSGAKTYGIDNEADDVTIENCQVTTSGDGSVANSQAGINISQGQRSKVRFNRCFTNGNNGIRYASTGAQGGEISFNVCVGNGALAAANGFFPRGIGVTSASGNDNVRIIGNRCTGNYENGIAVNVGAAGSAEIVGNYSAGNNLGAFVGGHGIECDVPGIVTGNTCIGNNNGISVTSSNVAVIGNICTSNSGSQANGIAINGTEAVVSGNICYLNANDGIKLFTSTSGSCSGNNCFSNTGFGIEHTSTGSVTFSGNTYASNTAGNYVFAGTALLLGLTGAGTPQSAVTAAVGSTFQRTDGGASTTLYVKESGTGNTGWVAK